mgnify:CR=1 FL=1
MSMIYGYIRVSSDKQTVENQRFEIERFCKVNNIGIDGWIEETISGTKAYNKRQLGVLLRKVQKDDVIICSELSRLGRSLFMIMEILSICMKKECRVWTIKDNYRLGDDIQSKDRLPKMPVALLVRTQSAMPMFLHSQQRKRQGNWQRNSLLTKRIWNVCLRMLVVTMLQLSNSFVAVLLTVGKRP